MAPVVQVPVHTYDAPNWAAAPRVDQSQLSNEKPRRVPCNRQRTDESNQKKHRSGSKLQECHSESIDDSIACVELAVPEFHPPRAHKPSFNASRHHGKQGYASIDNNAQNIWERPVAFPFRRSLADQEPPAQIQSGILIGRRSSVADDASSGSIPAVSKLTAEEVVALTKLKMYNIDLANLLRLAESSRTTQAEEEEDRFHKQSHRSSPAVHSQWHNSVCETTYVIDDRFWNTPHDLFPHNSCGTSNKSVTSPSSIFVPTYTSGSASVAPSSRGAGAVGLNNATWNEPDFRVEQGGTSAHAVTINSSTHSFSSGARGHTGEPLSRQRVNKMYSGDLESAAAFDIVDKLEGGTKEVYLRHGAHVSSKAVFSGVLAGTGTGTDETKTGVFTSATEGSDCEV